MKSRAKAYLAILGVLGLVGLLFIFFRPPPSGNNQNSAQGRHSKFHQRDSVPSVTNSRSTGESTGPTGTTESTLAHADIISRGWSQKSHYRKKLEALKAEKRTLNLQGLGSKHPRVREVDARIALVEEKLSALGDWVTLPLQSPPGRPHPRSSRR